MRPAAMHETSNRNRGNSQRSSVVYKKTACSYKIVGFGFGKDLLGRQLGYLCHNGKNLCKKFTFHTLKFVYFKKLLYFCTRIRTNIDIATLTRTLEYITLCRGELGSPLSISQVRMQTLLTNGRQGVFLCSLHYFLIKLYFFI